MKIDESDLIIDDKKRIVIPDRYINHIIEYTHNILAHPGVNRHYMTLKNYIFIKFFKKKIQEYAASCVSCQEGKLYNSNYGELKENLIEKIPYRKISMDILGPLNTKDFTSQKASQKIFILTIIDLCTRWVKLCSIENIDAKTIEDKFEKQWLKKYPKPEILITDQGWLFTNRGMRYLCIRYKIR
ncbi:hypothetical protein DMUE_1639 [Dictyocoela muelleri]|nr:hypothetical protein DMUE_1643 [Dictyocoela muelleri]KAG0440575.1 hypothetical protein DMUE_1639 [Dictyocoela muelleri]